MLDWRKPLLLTHRWLGIAGTILFITWFLSGIVMMYVRMPTLEEGERLARGFNLDLSSATLSPLQAAEAVRADPGSFTVAMLRGRPVYRFGGREGPTVFADDGSVFEGVDAGEAETVARRYAPGYSGLIRYDRYLTEPDQWTMEARAVMPLHRLALDDDAGTRLYVSELTGDVELRTTRRERFWAYLGPVLHWFYFAPLRRKGPLWSDIVIWSSLVGCVMCVTGLLWGLMRFSPRGEYMVKGAGAGSPYTGLLKWHHYAGLLFGAAGLTWAYSGLLSMEPFNWFATSGPAPTIIQAAMGGELQPEGLTLDSLRAALTAFDESFAPKELAAMQAQGEPFWAAIRPPSADDAASWMNAGLLPRSGRPSLERVYVSGLHPEKGSFAAFDRQAMVDLAYAAMPGVGIRDEVWLEEYDGHYYDARATRSLPVLRVRYDDPDQTWLYLDPRQGGIVDWSVRTTRLRRWLYHGLHSLDFPFLYFRRPLWDVVVIVLSLGGLVLSSTTLLPAWRRLFRHVASIVWWPSRLWRRKRALKLQP
jgi:hypothetical protein